MSDLKKQMIGALAWSSIDRFGQQAVQLVVSLLLARLLSPAEFGLIGMLLLFSALSYALIDGGLGQALIRKQDALSADYSSVFYLNFGVSIALYLTLFFSAPLIANFFRQPLLVPIARVVLLGIIFNALYIVPFVLMQKELDFKRLAKINMFSVLLSGIVGVCLAVTSFGVWALVAQQLGFHFFRMIFAWLFCSWKPVWTFSLNALRSLWTFSVHLLGISLLNVLFNNIYVVLLGRLYPLQQVGYFTQANKLSETANFTIQAILQNSTYAVLSKIHHQKERFLNALRTLSRITALLCIPLFFMLIAIARPLVLVLLSVKWETSIAYFQLLVLANLFLPIYILNVNALNSSGFSKQTLQLELIKKGLIVLSIFVCFSLGIKAMLIGFAVASFVSFLLSMLLTKRKLSYFYVHQLRDFRVAVLWGVALGLLCWAFSFVVENRYWLLTVQLLAATAVYVLILKTQLPFYFDRALDTIKHLPELKTKLIRSL